MPHSRCSKPDLYNYGPHPLDIVLVQGDDFSMTVNVAGDRDADTFTAAMIGPTGITTSFGITLGAYDSGAGTTPVTLTLTDTVSGALVVSPAYKWDLQWVSGTATRTLVAGALEVLADVT